MTFTLACLAVAVVATSAALVLTTRRRTTLSRPVLALFALNLAALVVAIVGTVLQRVG